LFTTDPCRKFVTHTIGSCLPVFFGSFGGSDHAVTSTVAPSGTSEFWYSSSLLW
jgi:hypothetical protein